MSQFLINPYHFSGIAPLADFTFNSIDTEVSADLEASVGGARTIVRTKGAGNDGYLSIDALVGTNNNARGGSRNIVRTSTGILYQVSQEITDDDVEIHKSIDDGNTWVAQDTTNEPLTDTYGTAIAIDSTDIIHIAFYDNGVGLRYCTFDTSNDTFGTPETADANTNTDQTTSSIGIAIDSNDKPHVVYPDDNSVTFEPSYVNKTSGSWGSRMVLQSSGAGSGVGIYADIAINDDDIPICSWVQATLGSDTQVSIGNQNNATSFTDFAVSTDSSQGPTSIVVETNGDIHVSWVDLNDDVNVRKHIKANAWSVWETALTLSNLDVDGTSMTIDQAGDLYVFTTLTGTTLTGYFKSTNGGRSYSAVPLSHNQPSFVDQFLNARWSFLNYHFPNKLDYVLNAQTANDIAFNTVLVDTYETWRDTKSCQNARWHNVCSCNWDDFK